MSEDRQRRAEALFIELMDVPRAQREARLDAACAGDGALRADVLSLLEHHNATSGFLDPAAIRDIAADEGPALLSAGVRVADYTILGVVGKGGMGVVYVAEQEKPRRTVALKVIRRGIASPALLRRFEHEAEVLGRLHHPGIAQIYAAGSAEIEGWGGGPVRQPYIAMELVNGPTLLQYCESRRLDTRERLELIARVCDAVQHAHQRGVIHRDLKPANILVDAQGQPKVLDFGVARATDADLHVTTMQTSAGQLVGTLPYMSPEQVVGDPAEVDTRSDVYALGVILFELLSGRLPLDLRSRPVPEAARIIRDDPPPRLGAINRSLAGDVETIVAKAIEKDKPRRYQSAADLRDDIRRHLAGQPIVARGDSALYVLRRQLRRHKGPAAAASLFVLGLAAFAVYAQVQSSRYRDARDAAELATKNAETARAVAEREKTRADEKARELDARLAESDIARGRLEALQGSVALGEDLIWPRLLADPGSLRARWALWEVLYRYPCLWSLPVSHRGTAVLALSPDGRRAAAGHADGAVSIIEMDTGRVAATLATPSRVTALAFAPDGASVFVGGAGGAVERWDVAVGARMTVFGTGGTVHRGGVSSVTVNADGSAAATSGADRMIRAWDLRPGAPAETWMVEDEPASSLAFSPDGTTLACATRHPDVRLRDAANGAISASLSGHQGAVVAAAYSADGRTLVSVSADRTARVWDPAAGACTAVLPLRLYTGRAIGLSDDASLLLTIGSDEVQLWDLRGARPIVQLSGHPGTVIAAALSPDGRRAISAGTDGSLRAWETMPGPARRFLLGHQEWVFGAVFDPEGRRVASVAGDGTIRLWDASTGAPGPVITVGPRTAWSRGVVFARDGTLVTGSSDGVIRLIDPATGEVAAQMTGSKAEVYQVSLSPDGQTMAAAGGDRVVRFWDIGRRAEIGQVTGLPSRVLNVAYAPDGATVYAASEAGVHALDTASFTDRGIIQGSEGGAWGLAVSADGRRLAAGGLGGAIRVWDLPVAAPPRVLAGHKRVAAGTALSPDGTLVASGSDDGTVRLWDAVTGTALATIESGHGEVSHVAFSPDGSVVSGSCQDRAIILINLRHFDRHIAGNLDYRLERHRGALPPGTSAATIRDAIVGSTRAGRPAQ